MAQRYLLVGGALILAALVAHSLQMAAMRSNCTRIHPMPCVDTLALESRFVALEAEIYSLDRVMQITRQGR